MKKTNSFFWTVNCKTGWAKMAFLLFFSALKIAQVTAQSWPISIDSRFDDWTEALASYTDNSGDPGSVDLLNFQVTNDDQHLFIRLEVDDEIELTDANSLSLYLDTDNNATTGTQVNGIGAELQLKLGDRSALFKNGNATVTLSLYEVGFFSQPSVSAKVFEMAIARDAKPIGNNPLFPGNTVKVYFQNGSSGDRMPNTGESFTYQFDETPTEPYEPVALEKKEASQLRLLTWNTLADGLTDDFRKPYFERVVAAIQPDIVTFNECWDMLPGQAATFMNVASPIGNFQSWKAVKLDEGNITVSRYPILQSWLIFPGHRLTASLIDLPDNLYQTDILVINGHLRCCDADNLRQQEADVFIKFILDAKTPGGVIDLPANTPFVLSGDLNLVGYGQQLRTLLTGQVVNTAQFGPGGAPDWDGTDLQDVIALHTDDRMAYTWYNDYSEFPPSRIDYHICSNSAMGIEKTYTLATNKMPAQRLAFYGLQANDTGIASDHLPKVTDFSLPLATSVADLGSNAADFTVFPNPASDYFYVNYKMANAGDVAFSLSNSSGKIVQEWPSRIADSSPSVRVDLKGLPAGVYFLKMTSKEGVSVRKVVKNG
ncbi:MAG: T9SS type A sorting domain-containing protein [Saprospiraceae bacterium]|nr:T9SS type A sorting domain-containing protein [Saprospiraceae bacterium]